jgi:hypothetical protein
MSLSGVIAIAEASKKPSLEVVNNNFFSIIASQRAMAKVTEDLVSFKLQRKKMLAADKLPW